MVETVLQIVFLEPDQTEMTLIHGLLEVKKGLDFQEKP